MSDSLRPHESQHARPPCPSPTPGVHSNSCPSSQWCHPAISSSVVPFPSCPNPSQHQGLFQWVSSSHEVAEVLEFQLLASVFPMNTQDWSPLGLGLDFFYFVSGTKKKKKKSPNLLMGTTEQFSNSRSPVLAPIHFSRCLGKDQHRWFKWKACLQKESLSAACPWGSISSGIQRSRWVSQFPDTVLLSTHPCRRSCLKRWSWYPAAVFSLYNVGMLEMYYEVRTHPKYS